MANTIRYESKNGYTGILYGKSSLAIFNPDGSESVHTGFRSINTYDELVKMVDNHPKFLEMLKNAADSNDEDEEI